MGDEKAFEALKEEMENLEENISNSIGKGNLMKELAKDYERGGNNINMCKMWKNFKRLGKKRQNQLPTAVEDCRGNLVTDKARKMAAVENKFKNRLRIRPVNPSYQKCEELDKELFQVKCEIAKLN